MSARKIKDAAVKLGEYTDRNGATKGRWANVGSLMKGDDGNIFMLLDRHFNPAGVPNPDGRGNVLISFFDLREDGQQGGTQQRQSDPGPGRSNLDDEIPF